MDHEPPATTLLFSSVSLCASDRSFLLSVSAAPQKDFQQVLQDFPAEVFVCDPEISEACKIIIRVIFIYLRASFVAYVIVLLKMPQRMFVQC